jgi:hypothetical protein
VGSKYLCTGGHIRRIRGWSVVVGRYLLLLKLGLVLEIVNHLVLQLLPLRLRHYIEVFNERDTYA